MPSRLAVLVLEGLARFLSWLPHSLAMAAGRGLGALGYLFAGSYMAVRIEPFFPGRGRRIARAHLAHLGLFLCEFLRASRCPGDLARIEVRGLEHLPSSGGVLLTGHFGNFELMGPVLGRASPKVATLAWRSTEPHRLFADDQRRGYGVRFIYISWSPRDRAEGFWQAGRLIEDGYIVAFLADTVPSEGVEMDFLGRRRTFASGGELLARRAGAPCAACFITRTPQGHVFEVLPLPSREPTVAFVRLLEERVRTWPEQYFWLLGAGQPMDGERGTVAAGVET